MIDRLMYMGILFFASSIDFRKEIYKGLKRAEGTFPYATGRGVCKTPGANGKINSIIKAPAGVTIVR